MCDLDNDGLAQRASIEIAKASKAADHVLYNLSCGRKTRTYIATVVTILLIINIFTAALMYGNQSQLYKQATTAHQETKEAVKTAVTSVAKEAAQEAVQEGIQQTQETAQKEQKASEETIRKLNELTQAVKQSKPAKKAKQ